MRWMLFLLSLSVTSCAFAESLVSGATFYQLPRAQPAEEVQYRFDDGTGWRRATARIKWADKPLYDYRIMPWGTLAVDAVLVRNGKRVSRAELKIPVRRDWRFDVHADIASADPTHGCFGCSRPAVSAPIAGSSERLWLWYGFNGISHRIIF